MEISSINNTNFSEFFVNKIREVKHSFNQKMKEIYTKKLNELETLKTEFDSINWNDDSYHYGAETHMPAYDYLTLLTNYDSKKEKYLSEIQDKDEKIAAYKNHTDGTKLKISLGEHLDAIKQDYLNNSEPNSGNQKDMGSYLMEHNLVSEVSINIPGNYDLLIESVVSFFQGEIYASIDINCSTKITTTNKSNGNIIYTNQYDC